MLTRAGGWAGVGGREGRSLVRALTLTFCCGPCSSLLWAFLSIGGKLSSPQVLWVCSWRESKFKIEKASETSCKDRREFQDWNSFPLYAKECITLSLKLINMTYLLLKLRLWWWFCYFNRQNSVFLVLLMWQFWDRKCGLVFYSGKWEALVTADVCGCIVGTGGWCGAGETLVTCIFFCSEPSLSSLVYLEQLVPWLASEQLPSISLFSALGR